MDQIVCIGYCGYSVVTMGNQQHWEITIFCGGWGNIANCLVAIRVQEVATSGEWKETRACWESESSSLCARLLMWTTSRVC